MNGKGIGCPFGDFLLLCFLFLFAVIFRVLLVVKLKTMKS